MSRNGQFGQGRRRNPAEQDPYAQQDPYAPQWPQQPAAYPDPNYISGGQQAGYHYPAEAEPYGGQGQMPGLDRFAPQQNGGQQQWGQQDPRGYDLGSYMPNGAQGYPQQQEPMQYAPPQQQGYAESEAEYDDGLEDGDDEPRSGRRWMVIAIALVGAIGLGGGLAYTYKMFFTNGSGRAPFVKNVEPPNKVKPVGAAKENAQVDKKLFTRLGEDSGEARGASGSEPEAQTDNLSNEVGGARPVRIIPIQPGSQGQGPGQVTTTGSTDSGGRAGGSPIVAVPGLTIDTGGPRGRAPQQGPQQQAAQQQGSPVRIAGLPQQQATEQASTEPVLPPRRPVTIPTTPTTQQGASATTSAGTGGTVQSAPKAPVQRKEASAVGGPVNTPVSSGYVAVLSSKKSRMDAMKAYASLDQKYRDMLASSTFDVQEADLGDKGVWYRAVIGPPRSYEGAKKICEDLKAAGHPDCWPARY
jgi:SPOR domain